MNWSRQRGKSEEKKKQSDKTKQKGSAWNLRNGIIIVASMIKKKNERHRESELSKRDIYLKNKLKPR